MPAQNTVALADTRILTVDKSGDELVIRIAGVPDTRVDADISDARLARVIAECIRRSGTRTA